MSSGTLYKMRPRPQRSTPSVEVGSWSRPEGGPASSCTAVRGFTLVRLAAECTLPRFGSTGRESKWCVGAADEGRRGGRPLGRRNRQRRREQGEERGRGRENKKFGPHATSAKRLPVSLDRVCEIFHTTDARSFIMRRRSEMILLSVPVEELRRAPADDGFDSRSSRAFHS